jgi:hypothetical protein
MGETCFKSSPKITAVPVSSYHLLGCFMPEDLRNSGFEDFSCLQVAISEYKPGKPDSDREHF